MEIHYGHKKANAQWQRYILAPDGVNIAEQNAISVYPNPASNQLVISYKSESDGYFKLYNAVGDLVISTSLSKQNSKTQLQLNDIANGIYHYEIEFANMKKTIGKLSILK